MFFVLFSFIKCFILSDDTVNEINENVKILSRQFFDSLISVNLGGVKVNGYEITGVSLYLYYNIRSHRGKCMRSFFNPNFALVFILIIPQLILLIKTSILWIIIAQSIYFLRGQYVDCLLLFLFMHVNDNAYHKKRTVFGKDWFYLNSSLLDQYIKRILCIKKEAR